jgi:SHS2 domain-containing protein
MSLQGKATSLQGKAMSLQGKATSLQGKATSLQGKSMSLQGAIVLGVNVLYTGCMLKELQEIEHTADWAVRVQGKTLPDLFINAASGMYGLATAPAHVAPLTEHIIEVAGIDAETLLVNWLNELLYYTETKDLSFAEFEITRFAPDALKAVARGQTGVPLNKHIKAVTFHDLRITQSADGYEATIVFDV